MKENYSVEGQYDVHGTTREFAFDYESSVNNAETASKLTGLLQSPFKLIKEGRSLGIKGIKRLAAIVVLFSISNTVLFIYAISSLFLSGYDNTKMLFVLLITALGFAFTFYAGYRGYQYVVGNTLEVIYKNFTPLFQKLCSLVIDKIEKVIKKDKIASDSQLAKAVDFGKMVNEHYKGMPSLIKTRINKLLDKVPVTAMISDLHNDIMMGDKEDAGMKLYLKLDDFVNNSIFDRNNTRWIYWLLPLNIIVQIFIIKFKLG